MANDGLTQEEINNMDPSVLQKLLDSYAAVIVNTMPNIKIGQKLEIPIGPNVKMYYKVSAKMNGGSDVDLNYVINDQKLEFKNFSANLDSGYGLSTGINSDNELSVSSSIEGGVTTTITNNGFSLSSEKTMDCNTYVSSASISWFPPKTTVEESITTNLTAGSVTSTIGIEYTANDPAWKPLPEPVPVVSPYACQLPEFNVDWDSVPVEGKVVLVIIGGVALIALIIVAPPVGVPLAVSAASAGVVVLVIPEMDESGESEGGIEI